MTESKFLNKKAPAFSLPDKNGEKTSLKDFAGKFVLLYFYPKDLTAGCTIEAIAFNKKLDEFHKNNATVVGVSVDSCDSHVKFTDKHKLNFTLLSDENKIVVEKYKVWRKKNFMGNKYMGTVRESFLINPKGTIVKHYTKVNPIKHADEVLKDIKKLNS